MEKSKAGSVELTLSKLLRAGVMLSAAIILIGFIMFLITGQSGYPGNTYPTTVGEIYNGLIKLKPYGIIMTGLLLLIATPVFRVGVSIILFAEEKDYLYVKITALVFAVLIFSLFIGKAR